MVLLVVTVFVMGTVARWRAVRAGRRPRAERGRWPPPTPTRRGTRSRHSGRRRSGRRLRIRPGRRNRPGRRIPPAAGAGRDDGTGRRGCSCRDRLGAAGMAKPAEETALAHLMARDRAGGRDIVLGPPETRTAAAAQAIHDAERPRPRPHLEPGPVVGDKGRPGQAGPGPPLRPRHTLRHPGPPPLVPHLRLRGQADRRGPRGSTPRPGPPHRQDRPGAGRHGRDSPAQLSARRRHRGPHRPPHPPVGPGHPGPGGRTRPPYEPQGRTRRGAANWSQPSPRTPNAATWPRS